MVSLEEKIRTYYEDYYRCQLGIPSWEKLVNQRLQDNGSVYVRKHIENITSKMRVDLSQLNVLVVGCGTGEESLELAKLAKSVTSIDINSTALEIVAMRAAGLSNLTLRKAPAESLPFEDASFDLIYSVTVLEHVQGVHAAIAEIHRVCKQKGIAYLSMPDYRVPYEGHYKLFLPLFLPRPIIKLALLMYGRPIKFIDHLNFVTSRSMMKLFKDYNFDIIRLFTRMSVGSATAKGFRKKIYSILNLYLDWREIYPSQDWFLIKK